MRIGVTFGLLVKLSTQTIEGEVMAHWKTSEIKAAIEAMPLVKKVTVAGFGGDYDTNEICVSVENASDTLFVCGFGSAEKTIEALGATVDDVPDCEFASLSDGLSSRGGLNSSEENVAKVYASIFSYLKKRGFVVIRHYSEIF